MTRTLLALTLSLTTVGVGAADWPWQQPASIEAPPYCLGFVAGGLASKEVAGMSRTDLWLAWSYVIRSAGVIKSTSGSDFKDGLAQFQNAPDAAAAKTVLQNADGNCGLGRSGHQITGW
jgi:hypothetical protein